MKITDLVRKYRKSVNPPYRRRDAVTILLTLLILLVIPLTVFGVKTIRDWRPKAAVTLPPIEITAGARQTIYQDNVPHVGTDGSILTSYDPARSTFSIGIYWPNYCKIDKTITWSRPPGYIGQYDVLVNIGSSLNANEIYQVVKVTGINYNQTSTIVRVPEVTSLYYSVTRKDTGAIIAQGPFTSVACDSSNIDYNNFQKLKAAGFDFGIRLNDFLYSGITTKDTHHPAAYDTKLGESGFKLVPDLRRNYADVFDLNKTNLNVWGWLLSDDGWAVCVYSGCCPNPTTCNTNLQNTYNPIHNLYTALAPQTSQLLFASDAGFVYEGTDPTLNTIKNWWPNFVGLGDSSSHYFYPDLYDAGMTNIAMISSSVLRQSQIGKPSWFIPKAFAPIPAPSHERAFVYNAVVHGATGIVYFSFDSPSLRQHEPVNGVGIRPNTPASYPEGGHTATSAERTASINLWNSIDASQNGLNKELKDLSPVILSPTSTELYQVFVNQRPISTAPIRTILKFYNGSYYLFAVNIDRATITAGFSFSGELSNVTTLYEVGRVPSYSENNLVDDFAPFAVHIYRFQLPSGKPGDLDGDNDVDITDLSTLITRWGSSDATADINDDGVVDVFDLSILLSNWGT